MRHTTLFAAILACTCCGERHRHLVCADGDGNVVVDTRDLKAPPEHYPTAWGWWTKRNESYHMISVPPHVCTYESHWVEEATQAPPEEQQSSQGRGVLHDVRWYIFPGGPGTQDARAVALRLGIPTEPETQGRLTW
jgi:hypothetical protein